MDLELSSRLRNCSTSISDKVKEYFNTMVENSYFKIISGGKASSCHINTHIAGLTNTNYPSDSLTFSQTVQYVNLAVGLILVVALLVGFCQRHKWTKGKSIFGHLIKNLIKGKVFVLLGKAKGKRCHGSENLGKIKCIAWDFKLSTVIVAERTKIKTGKIVYFLCFDKIHILSFWAGPC